MRKTSNPALTATTLQSAQPSPFVVIERVIECVGVGVLILGVLLLGASYVVSLVHVVQGLPGISIPQQLFNLFNFAVIEGFGLVLLSGRGRLPYLSPKVLSSIVGSTFEAIPKLIQVVVKGIGKPFSRSSHPQYVDLDRGSL
jgi:hypothetical protein